MAASVPASRSGRPGPRTLGAAGRGSVVHRGRLRDADPPGLGERVLVRADVGELPPVQLTLPGDQVPDLREAVLTGEILLPVGRDHDDDLTGTLIFGHSPQLLAQDRKST